MKLNFDITSKVDKNKNEIELEKIYFRLNMQGRGYGTIFLKFAYEFAKRKSASSILLDVLASNTRAKSFYLKEGFIQHSNRKMPYSNFKKEHRTMLVMKKILDNK